MSSVSASTSLPVTTPAPSEREKLHKAAQAFEALLVKQMLTSARAANFGNELLSGQGGETFTAMQDERFAQIAAERGGLGFARVIEAQLAKRTGVK